MNIRDVASKVVEAEHLLKALANRSRLTILCELHGGERAVAELGGALGLSQSALSQHLARLREDGLVRTRREGTSIFYMIADQRISRVVAMLHDLYCNADPNPQELEQIP